MEVSASPVSLDQTNNTLNTGIARIQAQELPLNGQNWATLTALVPTAVDTAGGPGAGNQRSIRYAGRGRDDNNYTYDGIDATYIINQSQLYFVRAAIPLDTIEEIRVDPILATAQTGATGGGQVGAASSSGTNRFHGDAYDFLRNSAFDATDPIDSLNPNHQPSFHLNQFGGSLGGPIVRNKAFFFVAYEGYQQDLGQTLIGYVPSPAFRSQVLAKSPALAPVINAYPVGQNTTSDPNVSQFVGQGSQVGQENSGMFRLDYRFSDATNLFWRANIDQADYHIPFSPSSGQYLDEREELTSYPVNSVIALTHVFSPTLLTDFKFGFNRGTTDTHLPQSDRIARRDRSSGPHFVKQRPCQHRRGQFVFLAWRCNLGQGKKCNQGRSRGPPHTDEPGEQFLRHDHLQLALQLCGQPSQ